MADTPRGVLDAAMTPAARPRRRPRRWRRWLGVALLLGAVALVGYEGPLAYRMAVAVGAAFPATPILGRLPSGDLEYDHLMVYPARRLAAYLWVPDRRWQRVACFALGEQAEGRGRPGGKDDPPEAWDGVRRRLVALALCGDEKTADAACRAFRAGPPWNQAQVAAAADRFRLAMTVAPAAVTAAEWLSGAARPTGRALTVFAFDGLRQAAAGEFEGVGDDLFALAIRHGPHRSDDLFAYLTARAKAGRPLPWMTPPLYRTAPERFIPLAALPGGRRALLNSFARYLKGDEEPGPLEEANRPFFAHVQGRTATAWPDQPPLRQFFADMLAEAEAVVRRGEQNHDAWELLARHPDPLWLWHRWDGLAPLDQRAILVRGPFGGVADAAALRVIVAPLLRPAPPDWWRMFYARGAVRRSLGLSPTERDEFAALLAPLLTCRDRRWEAALSFFEAHDFLPTAAVPPVVAFIRAGGPPGYSEEPGAHFFRGAYRLLAKFHADRPEVKALVKALAEAVPALRSDPDTE